MIAIVDYGVGNLFSLKSSLDAIGVDACVTSDESVLRSADKIILPGVGAFRDAITKLRESGLDRVVVEEAQNGRSLWESVSVCRCFLKKALSTESGRDSDF